MAPAPQTTTSRHSTGALPMVALGVALGLVGCKSESSTGAARSTEATAAPPAGVEGSCKRVCDRQTMCLGVPEYTAECVQICQDQAKEPEQKKALLAAHKRVIAECFAVPCSDFDACFRRVIGQETERVAKAVGASANIEITPSARKAFKELFCKIATDSGGSRPNVADPNASPDIKKWHAWMEMLAQDPALMQTLLKESEAECAVGVTKGTATVSPPAGRLRGNLYAYAFHSDLNLGQMLTRLETLAQGKWHQRFKDDWGDYLFGRLSPAPYNAVAKLLVDGDHFVINIKQRPEKPGGQRQYADVHTLVTGRLLPALGARSIAPVDYVE